MKNYLLLALLFCGGIAFAQGPQNKHITYDRIAQNHDVAQLRASAAWSQFEKEHGKWYVEFDKYSGLPARAFGGQLPLNATSIPTNDLAKTFIQTYFPSYDFPINQFSITAEHTSKGVRHLVFQQFHDELLLEQSYFHLKINAQDEVIFFGFTGFNTAALPNTTWNNPTHHHGVINELLGANKLQITFDKSLIKSTVKAGNYALLRAHRYEAISANPLNPLHYSIDLDEGTGEVLEIVKLTCDNHGQNEHAESTFTHSCSHSHNAHLRVEKQNTLENQTGLHLVIDAVYNPLQPIDRNLPVRNMEVLINGNVHSTNWNGLIEGYNQSIGDQLIFKLKGQFADVFNSTVSAQVVDTIVITSVVDTINISSSFSGHDRAGYVYTDLIWTHFEQGTGDTLLRNWAPIEVNVLVDGQCNAFYRNNTINFFKPSATCPSTVLFSDVVYHEFGHFINSKWPGQNGGQMRNGAINEGYADFWSLSITEYPILGQGWRTTSNTNVRRYDINPKRFPENVVFQVHGDGEIICGAWWDTYKLLGDDMDTALDIFIGANRNYVDFVNDYGEQFRSILIEALFADDDDGTFNNGTPNASEIIQGFAMHGITLLYDLELKHDEVARANPMEDVTVDALAESFIQGLGGFLQNVNLHYRTNQGTWATVAMNNLGNEYFQGVIPGQAQGSIVQYYLTTSDPFNNPGASGPYGMQPLNPILSNIPYSYLVGYDQIVLQNFENHATPYAINPDGNDGATAGQWAYGKPKATIDGTGAYVQTQFDHTPNNGNNACYFTGQSTDLFNIDQNDVEFGKTSLLTETFDISSYSDPVMEYWRWFSNGNAQSQNPQNDLWEAHVSADGVTWVAVDLTFAHEPQWRKVQFHVHDYLPGANQVQLKFITSDSLKGAPATGIGQSIVEAAIDDIAIYDLINVSSKNVHANHTFEVYPNPNQGDFTIRLNPEISGSILLEIVDISGKVLTEKKLNAKRLIPLQFDGANGIYMIRLTHAKQTSSRKILINFKE